MAKTKSYRRHKKSRTNYRVLPQVEGGLEMVGNKAIKASPVVEKGISNVYNTLATGFDMGIKGVQNTVSISRRRRHKKSRKSRRARIRY
jgi:SPX domain protein involved in polyphosphate accumulation